ncbi:hypothetical protein [Microcoleus vaginatus]|uniref:hypothetical protein n=1 Tax=Microcoleus vaginatus TaxID=119532 RepID=UPI00403F497C
MPDRARESRPPAPAGFTRTLRAVLARSNDRSVIATVNKITTSNTIVTVGSTNPAIGSLALRPIAISACSIALISRLAPDLVTPAIRRSRDTITLDNLLLNIDAFLNNFSDGIAGSYCSTVQSHLYCSHFLQVAYQPLAQI